MTPGSGAAGPPREPGAARAPVDPSPAELGRRIKLLRVSRGLTLKDLEHRGGVSATHVSEIERGRASPTVGALARIAGALGVRPAALIESRAVPEVKVTRASDRHDRRVQWGQATLDCLGEPGPCSSIGVQIMTLPLDREPALVHRHQGEEWVTVLIGVAEVRVADEKHVLREGDSLHFRANHLHSYANPASSPAVLLSASRPALSL